MKAWCLVFLSITAAHAATNQGSAVQKVIELLGECKAKVLKDLDEETAAMKEYTAFCDNEVKDKTYAIETAGRGIEEAKATIADAKATIDTAEDEIATLGTTIAAKEKELAAAQKVRAEAHENFVAAEKELVTSVDQLGRAVQVLKKGSFLQTPAGHLDKKSFQAIQAIGTMIESQWVTAGSRKTLKSFLQSAAQAKDSEDDEFALDQPQAKQVAYESSSGNIIQTIEEMQGKAEDTLSELRKKEMSESQEFQMLEGGLKNEISHGKSKLSANTKLKAESEQASQEASGELAETEKTKAADEAYIETMKQECQAKAVEYEETMKSGKAEIGAIEKATQILEEGVTAFVEVSSRVHRSSSRAKWTPDDDEESDNVAAARAQIVNIFKGLAQNRHSFVFAQLAQMAASDPFAKIKGLINDMIEKLLKEAAEAATHEAFCQEEMGKSKKSQADKQMKLDKFSTRVDEASSKIAELTEAIKTLEAEIAEIDKGQAEATAIRTKENEEFSRVSKDYKDSATAVAKAIEVLQSFYSGASLMQIKSSIKLQSQTKAHAKGNGDAANVIIGVLEVAQEDFTSLLAEAEAVESEAQTTYDKMTTENKIAKASKGAEAKAKASELKSMQSSLEMSKEDQAATSKELDAVNAYIDKLKPECESKAMSYEEKKAAREAEIAGLKDALSILSSPGAALVQTGHFLKRIQRV